MTIRAAVPGDAAAIAGIRVSSWRAAYEGIVPSSVLDRMDAARHAELVERRIAEAGTAINLVIEVEGQVVGYAVAGPARDEDAADLGEIWAIYLAPDARGRGLGRPLLDAAVSLLADTAGTTAVLWVLTDNAPARRFYERAGFQPDGATRMLDFDGTPVEEIRLRRSITSADTIQP